MERWENIKGYEGIYQISDKGRVKSLLKKERFLKGHPNNNGYLRVVLKGKNHFIHRLVAEAFVKNKHDSPCVNHIDNNPLNNHYSNLEWCTHKENMAHAQQQGRMKMSEERKNKIRLKSKRKKIGATIINTGETEVYNSIQEASRVLKGSAGNICDCCKNPYHTYYGRRFYYL